jgi:hypothetical protein
MTSNRTKRIGILLGTLVGLVVLGVVYVIFMATRDVSFDWENPNAVEALEARRKLKRYETSLAKGQQGWVRFSQLEINSYLMGASTNEPPEGTQYRLRRVGVELTATNATLYSWGERHVLSVPVHFVLQRTFRVRQTGTNIWEMPMDEIKIGDMEVPKRFWHRLKPAVDGLDEPLREYLRWGTNIQGMAVAKNDVSQLPELRLYTYPPKFAESH